MHTMRAISIVVASILAAARTAEGKHVFRVANRTNSHQRDSLVARADDPSDFSWVKRWAAIGDSFTAGIGSGAPLGSQFSQGSDSRDWYCSRYDEAYPMIVNDALGSSIEDFQFLACSGDRSGGIYNQIVDMDGNLDLVMMTAGGNDLCLASMIASCVFIAASESDCEEVISIAQDNLDSILKPNLKQLLDALDDKMNDDSIVVFNGYAQFFNTDNEDCATDQDWTMVTTGTDQLTLTVARRKTFNNLVVKINNAIKEVVDDAVSSKNYKYLIGFSNWGVWPIQGVDGQLCDPASTGAYPDPEQPDLQFFKPDTRSSYVPVEKRDDAAAVAAAAHNASIAVPDESERISYERLTASMADDEAYNDMIRRRSVNPLAQVDQQLSRRFPSRANCPGDKDVDVQPPSIGLPDAVGKNFHPNQLGHYTIASWALQTVIQLRAKVLGNEDPASCSTDDDDDDVDEFTCAQDEGSKKYASESALNKKKEEFCDAVKRPSGEDSGWSFSKTYYKNTPDEVEFKIQLSDSVSTFDKDECNDSIDRIINSCDGNDPDNPMDWKFGGEWKRGDYTYTVSPMRDNRPWPVIQETDGSCKGWYHGVWSSYVIKGRGWFDSDWGQDSLLSAAKSCVGGGITLWRFKYFDEPDEDGMEWKADFDTPIFVRSRCFKNNKVAFKAGGFTHGCGGND